MTADLALNLPLDTSAARVARAAATSYLAGKVSPQRLSDLTVVVSELVSNALEHGRGQVVLRLRFDEGTVYGEVTDQGGGFEHEIRARGPGEVKGRGLFMVAALSKRWGIHEGTTHVWFQFAAGADDSERPPPRLGQAQRPGALD